MKPILIRPYQPEDWPRIEAIHDSARKLELELAGLSEAFVPLKLAADREGLFDYRLHVAVVDGIVTGFAAHSEDELAWLYVDPAHTRQGIGRALVQYALGQMTARPVTIEVLQGNLPAQTLYERMGFRMEETLSGVMPGNEAFPVTVHVMQLG